jgi:hypothetical protein
MTSSAGALASSASIVKSSAGDMASYMHIFAKHTQFLPTFGDSIEEL